MHQDTANVDALSEAICDIGRRMYAREMGAANDGNISARLDDERLLCTPTGVSKGFMTPDMLCVVDLDGALVESHTGARRPSSEIKMHSRVYRDRPDVRAVVHGHPLYATASAVCGKPLDRQIMPEATVLLGEVPVVPFALPSTRQLPDSIAPYLPNHDALLLANHGALTFGTDLYNAYFKLEALEYYAKMLFLTDQMGGPNEFDSGTLDALIDLRRNKFTGLGRHPFLS